jgi:hypothetical protein
MDATIEEQAKEIERLRKEIARLQKAADKKPDRYIPSLCTTRTIADSTGRSLATVLSVIHLHSILPTAFADDIPLFDQDAELKIVALLSVRRRKRKPPAVKGGEWRD